jgi:hypothetical protein
MHSVKARSPLLVTLLGLFTLGLYFLYWFYKVNQEAALIANDRRARPGRSLLAISLGSVLIIPPYRTLWTTAQRVGRATGSFPSSPANFIFSILLSPLAAIVYVAWIQGKLNRHVRMWEARQRQAELMQRVQVRVVGVQAEIQPER